MIYTDRYRVGDMPLPVPDAGVEMTLTDIDAADAGRDESGYLHRQVVRRRVRSWNFCYSLLTEQELAYIESVFAGGDVFQFAFPGGSCTAYCSNHSYGVYDLSRGIYRNCKFSVIEC